MSLFITAIFINDKFCIKEDAIIHASGNGSRNETFAILGNIDMEVHFKSWLKCHVS